MGRYVAFLRGMNLGRRRIKNDELVSCFEGLGFDDASAFLASGNVIFSARTASETKIEEGLSRALEYPVPTFLRRATEITTIAVTRPFSDAVVKKTAGNLQVALLKTKPRASAVREALAFQTASDRLKVEGQELFWLPRQGISDSELDLRGLEKILGPMTMRTHRTLIRLDAKLR